MENLKKSEVEGIEDYLRRTAVGSLTDALVLVAEESPPFSQSNRVTVGWYWHDAYRGSAQYDRHYLYEDYAPAFRVGYLYHLCHPETEWEQAQAELKSEWDVLKGVSRLAWSDARRAVRSAWQHARDAASGVAGVVDARRCDRDR